MTAIRQGDWRESANMVLAELERLDREHRECRRQIMSRVQRMEIEIALLNQKARIWGFIGGMLPVLLMLGVGIVTKLSWGN